MERIKIVPWEKAKFGDNEVVIDEVSVTYHQDHDCTEDEEVFQNITLSTRNNGCARFINIKTENWSIDPFSEDFETILKDFCKRAGIEPDKEEKEI